MEETAIAVSELRHELHELSQPLTRLQWRLEIGQRVGDEATLRQAVEGGLGDLRELMEHVRRLRAQLAHRETDCEARDVRDAMEVRR